MQEQLATFLSYLQKEKKYSINTIAAYRNDLGQFLKYLNKSSPSGKSLNNVTSNVISDYIHSLKQQQYASSSIARKVAAVKSFFHYLFAKRVVDQDPTRSVVSPKVEKRLPTALSHADIHKLLSAPVGKVTPKRLRDTALLVLLYATGMRVTEVVSLQLADISLDDRLVTCAGKNGEKRILPYDENAGKKLQQYLDNGRPYLAKNASETALFLNHRGKQLTRQGLWLIIKAYAKNVDLNGDVTPHTLRHSFAAHKLNEGSNLQEIQQLLGHANISTTQVYNQTFAKQS